MAVHWVTMVVHSIIVAINSATVVVYWLTVVLNWVTVVLKYMVVIVTLHQEMCSFSSSSNVKHHLRAKFCHNLYFVYRT